MCNAFAQTLFSIAVSDVKCKDCVRYLDHTPIVHVSLGCNKRLTQSSLRTTRPRHMFRPRAARLTGSEQPAMPSEGQSQQGRKSDDGLVRCCKCSVIIHRIDPSPEIRYATKLLLRMHLFYQMMQVILHTTSCGDVMFHNQAKNLCT